VNDLQWSRGGFIGFQGSRIQGFERNAKVLLAGDVDFIEKGLLCTTKNDIADIERMLKALIKSLENKPLNPFG
jgi:hypothetical protein